MLCIPRPWDLARASNLAGRSSHQCEQNSLERVLPLPHHLKKPEDRQPDQGNHILPAPSSPGTGARPPVGS